MTLILDAGALIAFERNDRHIVVLLTRAVERGQVIVVPAGVVAQVWRNPSRQARLARLLNAADLEVAPLDDQLARAVGQLLGARGVTDVVDACVAILARQRTAPVVTSDTKDLKHLDATLRLIEC